MDQCELNSNNDNSQGGKHNVKQKKKITKTSTGSVVFLREGSIHKETAKCHDESSPTFPFFSFFFHKWVTWEIFQKHTQEAFTACWQNSSRHPRIEMQHGNVQRTARTTWSCQSSTAAAGQQDSTQGGWRCQCGILFFFFWPSTQLCLYGNLAYLIQYMAGCW